MQKILYVVKYPLSDIYNLKQKFDGQISAFEDLGCKVTYLCWDQHYYYLKSEKGFEPIMRIFLTQNRLYIHTFAFVDLFRAALKLCRKEQFDIAYFRSMPFGYFGEKLIKKLKKIGTKIIVEIPSYPKDLLINTGKVRKLALTYFDKRSHYWKQFVDLFVVIGADVKGNYLGRKAINIDNGINTDVIPVRSPHSREDDGLHLLMVASYSYWQGVDRLIRGLSQYSGRIPVVLHLVGQDGDGSLGEIENLVKSLGLIQTVKFKGPMYGSQLDEIFNYCDLGIGTLGLYRKNANTGSILKLREYTTRGLPFVYANEDPALTEELFFCLRVPNDDSVINVLDIVDFFDKLKILEDVEQYMHDYAVEHMSWKTQMQKVLDNI